MAASSRAIELHRRDIHRFMLQHTGHLCHMAGLIQIVNDQRRKISAEVCLQSVDPVNHDPSPADRRSLNLQLSSGLRSQIHTDRIRMCVFSQIDRAETVSQSFLFCNTEAVRNPAVIHREAHQAGDQRLIGSMPLACRQKRSVKQNFRIGDFLSDQLPADISDLHGACGMRAGRSDHHGPYNIKDVHSLPPVCVML